MKNLNTIYKISNIYIFYPQTQENLKNNLKN